MTFLLYRNLVVVLRLASAPGGQGTFGVPPRGTDWGLGQGESFEARLKTIHLPRGWTGGELPLEKV